MGYTFNFAKMDDVILDKILKVIHFILTVSLVIRLCWWHLLMNGLKGETMKHIISIIMMAVLMAESCVSVQLICMEGSMDRWCVWSMTQIRTYIYNKSTLTLSSIPRF